MGVSSSRVVPSIASFIGNKKEDEDVVLVPPLFERDFRGRSRMSKSSYDWLFSKPERKWLFKDYIRQDEVFSILRFRPSEDQKVSVHARLAARNIQNSSIDGLGSMTLRVQPQVEEPLSFLDIKTGTQAGPVARACFFSVDQGCGVFSSLPVQNPHDVTLGLRYSSPGASVGLVTQPARSAVDQAWAVIKHGPFCAGLQLDLGHGSALQGLRSMDDLAELIKSSASYALSYSPVSSTGRSNFTTAVELRRQSELTVSLLYHMAVQRQCKNPLEDHTVVGMTNYIDLGLQVSTNLVEDRSQKEEAGLKQSSMGLAGSWQVNKNWLAKARVSSSSASLAVALKAWWQPSLTAALSTSYNFATRRPRIGVSIMLENYGNVRYERAGERVRVGKALVQRHVAFPEDITNKEGEGILVHSEDMENKVLLGQTQVASAAYL